MQQFAQYWQSKHFKPNRIYVIRNDTILQLFYHLDYQTGMDKDSQLTVIARIEAKEDKVEEVKAALLKAVEATRAEEGCINYDLHQDNEHSNIFVFYENWKNAEHLKAHSLSAHVKELMGQMEGKTNNVTLQKLTKL